MVEASLARRGRMLRDCGLRAPEERARLWTERAEDELWIVSEQRIKRRAIVSLDSLLSQTIPLVKLDRRRRVARNVRISRLRVCAKRPGFDTVGKSAHSPNLPWKLIPRSTPSFRGTRAHRPTRRPAKCRFSKSISKKSFVVVGPWHPVPSLWSESVSGRADSSQRRRN